MHSTNRWHIQYGPWDIRIHCPVCPQWETFFCSVLDVNNELVVKDFHCRTCGLKEPVQLIEGTQLFSAAVANSVRRDYAGGGPVGSDPNVYSKAREIMAKVGESWPEKGVGWFWDRERDLSKTDSRQ